MVLDGFRARRGGGGTLRTDTTAQKCWAGLSVVAMPAAAERFHVAGQCSLNPDSTAMAACHAESPQSSASRLRCPSLYMCVFVPSHDAHK
jgi:hypothetical protein